MKTFKHHNARSIRDAIRLLDRYNGKARLNAGGTDLIGVLKTGILPQYPEALINIKGIKGLDYIREEDGALRIGALTKLSTIIEAGVVKERYPLLAETAKTIAGTQIRNMATIGGNICQDVRCWYYRYPAQIGGPLNCSRKGDGPCHAVTGDNRYHAIIGGRRCFAVCPSDMATALACLNAQIVISGVDGERQTSIIDFYHPLGTSLKDKEMVKEILIPAAPLPSRQRFIKFTLRRPIDFAIVSVASLFAFDGEKVYDARLALGGVAPSPIRVDKAEDLLKGKRLDASLADEAGLIAVSDAKPLTNNGYKAKIAQTLIKRAVMGDGG